MLQLKNKKRSYFYVFAFLFLTTITNQNYSNIFTNFFLVKDVNIEANTNEIRNILKEKTKFLINENIFFLNRELILYKLKSLKFIENIKIHIEFPSTIKIQAKKTELIAITYINQKKYFVGLNGNFIPEKAISSNEKLPIIFGKFKIHDFIEITNLLKKKNFKYNKVNKYYFHKNKRWDLYFENNIIVMLPNKNIEHSLNIYQNFNKINQINPNTIIDLRIPKRLILKSE